MTQSTIILLIIVGLLILTVSVWLLAAKKYNTIDWGSPFLNLVDGIFRRYCYKFHGLQSEKISLPESGGAILISNHIGGVDPLVLIAACDRPVRFMIAKEEYERFGLNWLFKGAGCIPVDRTGRPDIAFRQAKRALEKGEVLALFPHGKIHLDHEQPYRVKAGIKRLAELSQARIFICRITGVRGQGSVFKPIFLRSNTHIQQFDEIDAQFFQSSESLQWLGEVLLGHRTELPKTLNS